MEPYLKRPRFLQLSSSSILIDLPCYDSASILLGSASEDKTKRYFVENKIRICRKVEDDQFLLSMQSKATCVNSHYIYQETELQSNSDKHRPAEIFLVTKTVSARRGKS